jgi:hypothetical protein
MTEKLGISMVPPNNCTEGNLNIALVIVGGDEETREQMLESLELTIKGRVNDVIDTWDTNFKIRISHLIN